MKGKLSMKENKVFFGAPYFYKIEINLHMGLYEKRKLRFITYKVIFSTFRT